MAASNRELAIAGDLRLSNLDSLATVLGLGAERGASQGLAVLAAYERWGDKVAEHLEGEFSFVIWDGTLNRVHCARDRFGVKPFYYHLGPGTFAFASEGAALTDLPSVSSRLDERTIADFLLGRVDDTVRTGYLDVSRLPPAQTLTVGRRDARFSTYWSLDPDRGWSQASDRECEEAFRSAFERAVAARLVEGSQGVSLSGGLDSSSIACVAGRLLRLPLRAYVAVFEGDPTCDEHLWWTAVAERCGAVVRMCDPSQFSPLAEWEGAPWTGARPVYYPQIAICRATLEAARADGVAVVHHGLGGDSVISHGLEHLTELVGAGRLMRATTEVVALGRRSGRDPRRLISLYAVRPFTPEPVIRAWRRARRAAAESKGLRLREDVLRRLGMAERHGSTPMRQERHAHYADLSSGIYAHAFEATDRVDTAIGVQRRYPFFDRDLVELCLSLAGDQKLRRGWTRSILRRSMVGLVPDEVRYRSGKGNYSAALNRALATTDRSRIQAVVDQPGLLTEFIDPSSLRELWHRCRAQGTSGEWFQMWRVAVAARWLNHHGFDAAAAA